MLVLSSRHSGCTPLQRWCLNLYKTACDDCRAGGKALSATIHDKVALQMMVNCCATDETACSTLKAEYPEVASSDPDMNPDFCAMHGNVCSRCAAV